MRIKTKQSEKQNIAASCSVDVKSSPKISNLNGVIKPFPFGSTRTSSGSKYTSSSRFTLHFFDEPATHDLPSVSG